MAKQIKDRCVRSPRVLPQPTPDLVLTFLREQDGLKHNRTWWQDEHYHTRPGHSSAAILAMLLRLITADPIHLKLLLPFKFCLLTSVDLRAQPMTGERPCCYAFVGPQQHPIRTILGFHPYQSLT